MSVRYLITCFYINLLCLSVTYAQQATNPMPSVPAAEMPTFFSQKAAQSPIAQLLHTKPFIISNHTLQNSGIKIKTDEYQLGAPEEIPLIQRRAIPFHEISYEWPTYDFSIPLPHRFNLHIQNCRPTFLPHEGNWQILLPNTINSLDSSINPIAPSPKNSWTYLDTPHFRIACDSNIDLIPIKRAFQQLETTFVLARQLPLHIIHTQHNLAPIKFSFCFYGRESDFNKAVTTKNALSIIKDNVCYLNGQRLGISKLNTSSQQKLSNQEIQLRDQRLYQTCAHDLTLMALPASLLEPSPFAEGLAMYISRLPLTEQNSIPLSNFKEPLLKTIVQETKKLQRDLSNPEKPFRFPAGFSSIMTAPSTAYFDERESVYRNQLKALLITAYFLHFDQNGNGQNLKNFILMRQQGFSTNDCMNRLKNGRSWDDIFSEFKASWQKYGLNVSTL